MTISTVGSGIGSSWGYVEEATWATVVGSPTWKFFEPAGKISMKKIKNPKQSSPLAAGRLVDVTSRRVVTSQAATASIPLEWLYAGHYTSLLNQLSNTFTTGAAGTQGAAAGIWSAGARVTTAAPVYGYSHTFRNNIAGRSVSQQGGIPDTGAVLRQFDMLGAKPTKYAWSIEKDSFLTCQTDWDGRVLEDPLLTAAYQGFLGGATQTPYTQATPSYVAVSAAHWAQSQIQIGASTAAASTAGAIDGVTKFEWAVEHPMNVTRQYMGQAGLKDEQIVSNVYKITGTVTSDLVNKQYWADAFYSDTPFSIIVTLAAGALSGTVLALQAVFNNVFLDGTSPEVQNPDVVNTSFPFQATYDLTNEPLMMILQTTDATV